MNLLVGLGNPGKDYSNTKHNFGFWILNRYTEKSFLTFNAGKGEYLSVKKENVLYAKPTSYMNNSGNAILDIKNYYKIKTKNILVVYDDIDLPLGMIKFKEKGGDGGHKGIESVIYKLQSDRFNRLRIGIATDDIMRPAEKYVLSAFKDKYLENVKMTIEKACEAIDFYYSHDINETMNKFNEKIGKD
jgi:PTH1 family peptidyl-tRNA hydrolase